MIDLHVHTTASDGALSPCEVVRLAVNQGLRAIAITDHDTVAGIPEALEEAQACGLEIVPGVELSAECKSGILHILGYYVRFEDPYFRRCLDDLRNDRQYLVRARLAKIRELGLTEFPLAVSDATEWSILEPGLLGNSDESFLDRKDVRDTDSSCSRSAAPYGPRANLLPHEAVKLISAAGGIPIVAHPYSIIKYSSLNWADVLGKLMTAGIQGLEAYSPTHTVAQTLLFLESAKRHGLLVTGGSDFHCYVGPDLQIGVVPGWSPLSYELVEHLEERVKEQLRRV
jgi:3',5'-nucleoside bisphosphate phosphatase